MSESAWSALRVPLFRFVWIAAIVSNVGTWMHNLAAAWLMTSLAPTPIWVSLVQTAISLPSFLLAMPAGALADITDRRRLLVVLQVAMLVVAVVIGGVTAAGAMTPVLLLILTFLLGCAMSTAAPAWQSAIPDMVPPPLVSSAILLNGVGFNLAIALGPAIGGVIVARYGSAAAFFVNAVSFLAVVAVLLWWKHERQATSQSPSERIIGATIAGIRYVRHAPQMHAILIRGAAFILFASAVWALLVLVARQRLGLSASGYGLLFGAMGVGAVIGAQLVPHVRRRIGGDAVVAVAAVLFGAASAIVAVATTPLVAGAAMLVAGVAWIFNMGTLMVASTTQVPQWVRARAVATFLLTFQGGMAIGSSLWGWIASHASIRMALLIAAGGLLVTAALPLIPRLRLHADEALDFSPASWPTPTVAGDLDPDDGPVVVTIEFHIDPADRAAFLRAASDLRLMRKREGAMRWRISRDVADERIYVESFVVESWGEHLRQHARLTAGDRQVEQNARAFHRGETPPAVRHLVAQRAE